MEQNKSKQNNRDDDFNQNNQLIPNTEFVINKSVEQYMKDIKQNHFNHLKFMLFPDVCDPSRIPDPYGIPSHIVSQKGSFTFSTGSFTRLAFTPLNNYGSFGISTFTNSVLNGQHAYGKTEGTTIQAQVFIDPYVTYVEDKVADLADGFVAQKNQQADFSAIRILGAYMKVSYIGKLDSLSGYMESGYSIERPDGDAFFACPDSQMQFLRSAKSTAMTNSIRAIYLPIDSDDSEYDRIQGHDLTTVTNLTTGVRTTYDRSIVNNILTSLPQYVGVGTTQFQHYDEPQLKGNIPVVQHSLSFKGVEADGTNHNMKVEWGVFYEGTPRIEHMLTYNPTAVQGTLVGLQESHSLVASAMPVLGNAVILQGEGQSWYSKAWSWIKNLAPYVKKGIEYGEMVLPFLVQFI